MKANKNVPFSTVYSSILKLISKKKKNFLVNSRLNILGIDFSTKDSKLKELMSF